MFVAYDRFTLVVFYGRNQTIQIANDLLTAKPDYSAADKVR